MNESEKSKSVFERLFGTATDRRASVRRRLRVLLCVGVSLATLIALFYVEEDWRGKRAWNAYAKAAAARGEILDIAALAPPPVPNDQNFALTPFLAPLFDFLPGTQTWRDRTAATNRMQFAAGIPDNSRVQKGDWHLGQRMDWPAWQAAFTEVARKAAGAAAATNATLTTNRVAAAKAVLAALQRCDPVLSELRTASQQRPQCRFNLRYDDENPASVLLPHLGVLKGCVRILTLRAGAELTLGQTDPALDDLDLVFYLTDAVHAEPFLISHLVRCAEAQLALQPVWEGLADRRWSDAQLQHLQRRLQRFDFLADARFALRGERAFGNGIFVYVRNHPRGYSDLGMAEVGNESESSVVDLLVTLMPRGWFYLEQLNYNRLFTQWIEPGLDVPGRRVYPQILAENEAAIGKSLSPGLALLTQHRILSAMLLPALTRACQRFAYAQTMLDEAALACALERYRLANGHYPDSLSELTPKFMAELPPDIITGEPLKYRRADHDRFVLYSVGWNGKDDGGTAAMSGRSKTSRDLNEGDWIWPQP